MNDLPIVVATLLANFLALIILCAISVYYYGRQARALEGMQRVEEDQYFFTLKRHRESKRQEDLVPDPRAWISRHVSAFLGEELAILDTNRVVKQPLAVDLQTSNGYRVVISPVPPHDMRRLAQPRQGKGAIGQLRQFAENPLLGRNPRRVTALEQSLATAGEYFDLEAAQVGKELGADWGAVDRLWFYVVPTN